MDRTGERLRKIRLDKGISLEEVSKKTKVSLNILKAIEDDGFINLEPVYVKGFIKIYCKFLGVQASEFITEQEPQVTMKLSDAEEKASTFLNPLPVKRFSIPWRQVSLLLAAAAVAVLLFFGVRAVVKFMAERSKQVRKPVSVSEKKKDTPRAVESRKKAQLPRTGTTAPAKNSVPVSSGKDAQSGIRLGLYATEDCWVQVKIDGKTVFQNVMFRGRKENWSAQDKIDLWLGSAGGVEIEVNGSRIPSLGRKGQVLKNVIITRDGLKVGK